MLADDLFDLPFGGNDLDRSSLVRSDTTRLRQLWESPESRLLLIKNENNVAVDKDLALGWISPVVHARFEEAGAIFLGFDIDRGALFGLGVNDEFGGTASFRSLREVALGLSPLEQSAAALAVALVTWHSRSSFCMRCGAMTTMVEAGHVRRCASCDLSIFPRSDAAVIMLVTDGERCVLGRRIGSALDRWSTLAGFVEAGESPEAALCREVFEEVGLFVDKVRYRGSQPWPFPSSLMLAYEAHAPHQELKINEEHTEVRWFTRDELKEGLSSGLIGVPSKISAGGHLITDWLSRTPEP